MFINDTICDANGKDFFKFHAQYFYSCNLIFDYINCTIINYLGFLLTSKVTGDIALQCSPGFLAQSVYYRNCVG